MVELPYFKVSSLEFCSYQADINLFKEVYCAQEDFASHRRMRLNSLVQPGLV